MALLASSSIGQKVFYPTAIVIFSTSAWMQRGSPLELRAMFVCCAVAFAIVWWTVVRKYVQVDDDGSRLIVGRGRAETIVPRGAIVSVQRVWFTRSNTYRVTAILDHRVFAFVCNAFPGVTAEQIRFGGRD